MTFRHYLVPGLMVGCTLLVAAWMVMAHFSRQPNKPFDLTPAALADFQPSLEGWQVEKLPIISKSVDAANIAAFSLTPVPRHSDTPTLPHSHTTAKLLVRLVHGYNMPMCMKMKYFTVEKIQDYKVRATTDPKLRSAFRDAKREGKREDGEMGREDLTTKDTKDTKEEGSGIPTLGGLSDLREKTDSLVPLSYPIPMQLWRLTSSVGTVSIWATTMIRAGTFATTEEDICTMAFPRIDIPDDPNWVPRGLAWEDLKHPRSTFMRWFHSRWDGARWDIPAFLGLRKRVRTSEELLSFVTRIENLTDNDAKGADMQALMDVHKAMLEELQEWKRGEWTVESGK